MDYRNYDLDQLALARSAARLSVRRLEKRGSLRTTAENEQLKFARACVREITRELAKRVTQLKLF